MARARDRRTQVCTACSGRGERRESVSYYDTDWVTCVWCKGAGERVVSERWYETPQPFELAND